jgi:hypothetical protein
MSNTGDSLLRIERLNYGLAAILCIGALILFPLPISLGVAVGAALTCANFAILRRLVYRWTSDAARGGSSNAVFLVLPKMVGLMAAVVAALALLPINAVAFVVGFSIFVASIVIEAVYSAFAPSGSGSDGSDGPAGPGDAASGNPSDE